MSIGALSRATGVPIDTLRTWERRYGFPVPERKPSGHRVYPIAFVPRLRRIAEALRLGLRAAEVVAASDDAIAHMVQALPSPGPAPADVAPAAAVLSDDPAEIEALLEIIQAFDADRLTRRLLGAYARLGPIAFLERRMAPILEATGARWEDGRLEIRHEHFVSERIGDLLRSLRLPYEERATGPLVILATLPGEGHGLGLQMAALVLTVSGCRILYLGTEVPPAQIAALARDMGARAVGVSISAASRGPAAAAGLRRLRRALPPRVLLMAGGSGASRRIAGVEAHADLRSLAARAQEIARETRG